MSGPVDRGESTVRFVDPRRQARGVQAHQGQQRDRPTVGERRLVDQELGEQHGVATELANDGCLGGRQVALVKQKIQSRVDGVERVGQFSGRRQLESRALSDRLVRYRRLLIVASVVSSALAMAVR